MNVHIILERILLVHECTVHVLAIYGMNAIAFLIAGATVTCLEHPPGVPFTPDEVEKVRILLSRQYWRRLLLIIIGPKGTQASGIVCSTE